MFFDSNKLIPIISATEYDQVASDFLDNYFPQGLAESVAIPIWDIAVNEMGMDVKEICLSEEADVYGATVFSDGEVDVYLPEQGIYEKRFFARKTILIDPLVVAKTNIGCMNNTLAHECFHWYKHRLYFKMQDILLPRQAKYCSCSINQINSDEDIRILENQAVGIAPRILMPKKVFVEAASKYCYSNRDGFFRAIDELSLKFAVSKQSVSIRLKECGLV